jgi:hypothetical protein
MERPGAYAGAVLEGSGHHSRDGHAIVLLFKRFVLRACAADDLAHSPSFALRKKAALWSCRNWILGLNERLAGHSSKIATFPKRSIVRWT